MKTTFKHLILLIILVAVGFSCKTNNGEKNQKQDASLEYVMDFVHNNLGLPPRVSKFNNTEFLESLGYNGTTPHWYVQCGITYDSLEEGIVPEGSDERKWILARTFPELDGLMLRFGETYLHDTPYHLGNSPLRRGEYDKERIRKAIVRYDELWEDWKELEENSPSCATIYEPNGFAIRGHLDIYGNPETGIGASVDEYRNL